MYASHYSLSNFKIWCDVIHSKLCTSLQVSNQVVNLFIWKPILNFNLLLMLFYDFREDLHMYILLSFCLFSYICLFNVIPASFCKGWVSTWCFGLCLAHSLILNYLQPYALYIYFLKLVFKSSFFVSLLFEASNSNKYY